MVTGYCTVDDVRRALREANLPGDAEQDRDILIDAIVAETEWFEKTYKRHFYVTGSITEDTDGLIPSTPLTRDDEHDIPTHGGFVHGASEYDRRRRVNSDALLESGPEYEHHRLDHRNKKREIRIAVGDSAALTRPIDETVPAYTRIRLDRRYVQTVNELSVIDETGAYTDWVASNDYDGGVGNANRGDDYWVRINNSGVAELYLDVHSLADEIASFANAIYVDFDFGYEAADGDDTKVRTWRRAIALRAGATFAEEAAIQIPENANIYNVETKAEAMREKAAELLDPFTVGGDDD